MLMIRLSSSYQPYYNELCKSDKHIQSDNHIYCTVLIMEMVIHTSMNSSNKFIIHPIHLFIHPINLFIISSNLSIHPSIHQSSHHLYRSWKSKVRKLLPPSQKKADASKLEGLVIEANNLPISSRMKGSIKALMATHLSSASGGSGSGSSSSSSHVGSIVDANAASISVVPVMKKRGPKPTSTSQSIDLQPHKGNGFKSFELYNSTDDEDNDVNDPDDDKDDTNHHNQHKVYPSIKAQSMAVDPSIAWPPTLSFKRLNPSNYFN